MNKNTKASKQPKNRFSKYTLLLLFFLIFVAGCSTFNQRFYAVSSDRDVSNYYRTTIQGWTFLSNSEFQAGAAPSEIVDRLLGQAESVVFAPPSTDLGKGSLSAAQKSAEERRKAANQTVLIDPFTGNPMPDQKIVIALSSDPNTIFQGLQSAVTGQDVNNALGSIILGQRSAKLFTLSSDSQRKQQEIQNLIDQLKQDEAKIGTSDQNALILLLQRIVILLQ
jgi:hypothetical protein